MSLRWKSAHISFFGLFLVTILAYGFHRLSKIQESGPKVGQRVPSFALVDLTGNHITADQLAGRKYALLFFSVECPHCKSELAELNSLLPRLPRDLKLIVASLNAAEETRRFKETESLALDLYPQARSLAKQIGVKSVPLLLLVDKEGRIQHVQWGKRGGPFQELVFGRFERGESLDEGALRAAFKTDNQ